VLFLRDLLSVPGIIIGGFFMVIFSTLRAGFRMLGRLISLPVWVVLEVLDTIIGNGIERVINRIEQRFGIKLMPYFFVLPNMLIFLVFILLPFLLNFGYGFTGGDDLSLWQRPNVGTQNFEELLTCTNYRVVETCKQDLFWRAVNNSLFFVALQVPLMVLVAMLIALALNRQIILRGFFRSAFFYPVLLSPVVVGIVWKWMLQDRNGLLNTVIQLFGGKSIDFLISPAWAMFWVIFVSIWAQVGFYTLIVLAGLQSIPSSLYEAAEIDGASNWKSFLHITYPLLRPTLLVVFVLSLIRGVQSFDNVYVLTGGGPGTATTMLVQYIYSRAFGQEDYGLAAAASLILAITLAILTMMQLYASRKQTEAV
jgi:alpha-1,4-digalacturonate transport system permease protein